jgi:hypothetical protein
MPPVEAVIKKVAKDLQETCNAFVFSDPSNEQNLSDVRQTLLSQLNGLKAAGVVEQYHVGNISIDDATGRIACQVHIQPFYSTQAGVISIGAREAATPETLAIQVPRDADYTDRWEFIKEELEEEDEILASEEKHKPKGGSDSSLDQLKRYMSENVSLAWKRLLR